MLGVAIAAALWPADAAARRRFTAVDDEFATLAGGYGGWLTA
jgi:hypothetical protein